LIRYLDARAYYTEAQVLAGLALDAGRDIDDQASEAVVLNLLGGVHYRIGHYGESRQLHEKALTLHRRLRDRSGEGLALYGLASSPTARVSISMRWNGSSGRCSCFARSATGRAKATRCTAWEWSSCDSDGIQRRSSTSWRPSRSTARRAIAPREGARSTTPGRCCCGFRYEEARSQYQQSLRVAYEVGNHAGQSGRAGKSRHRGRGAGRAKTTRSGTTTRRWRSAPTSDTGSASGRAARHRARVRPPEALREAVDYLRQAVDVADEIGEAGGRTLSLNDLGAVLVAAGHSDDAADTYRAALELARTSADRYEQACAHRGLATVLDERKPPSNRDAAIDIFDELGLPDADEIRRAAS